MDLKEIIYYLLHIISCPEEDMYKLNRSADKCIKCGRVRYNFTDRRKL